MNKNEFRLCGGIFLLLFCKACKRATPEKQVLISLIKVLNADYYDKNLAKGNTSFSKTVSEYKTCKSNGGSFIPFNTQKEKDTAKDLIEKDYKSALERMKKVISLHIHLTDANRILLVKELIKLIEADKYISDTQEFYVLANGLTLTKSQIIECDSICFEAFLLGVWYYSVIQNNKNGFDTYNYLCPPSNDPKDRNKKRDYIGCLGRNSQPIEITSSLFSDESITEFQNDSKVVSSPLSIADKNLLKKLKEDYSHLLKTFIKIDFSCPSIDISLIEEIISLNREWTFKDKEFQSEELNVLKKSIIENLNELKSFLSSNCLRVFAKSGELILINGSDLRTQNLINTFIDNTGKIQAELQNLFDELYSYQ